MRIIIINPADQTITEKDVPGQVDLAVLKRELGDKYIEVAGVRANGDILWVDEEGLLNGATDFFSLAAMNGQPLAGIGVITGPEEGGEDGEDIVDARTPLQWVEANVIFLGKMEATNFTTESTSEKPGVTVINVTPTIEPR